MRLAESVRLGAHSIAIGLATVIVMMAAQLQAVAAQEVKGSSVQAMVCPLNNQSSMSISSPVSDSVVDAPRLTISGNVTSISQIEIEIDDIHNNSVAIGRGETTFQTQVELTGGTHTVKLIATDSCGKHTHEDSFVITFTPQSVPSTGGSTATGSPAPNRPAGPRTSAAGREADATPGNEPAEAENPRGIPFVPKFVEDLFVERPSRQAPYTVSDTVKPLLVIAGLLVPLVVIAAQNISVFVAAQGSVVRWMMARSWPIWLILLLRYPRRTAVVLGILLVVIPFMV